MPACLRTVWAYFCSWSNSILVIGSVAPAQIVLLFGPLQKTVATYAVSPVSEMLWSLCLTYLLPSSSGLISLS